MKAISPSQLFKKRLGDWVVNTYQGCQHGCRFCYAPAMPGVRAQKFWRGRKQAEWGTVFQRRSGLLEALQAELQRFTPAASRRTDWGDGWILVSFLCDPYQPIEEDQGITRRALELLLSAGHKVRVQTRSCLVERDFDLLARYPDRVRLGVSLPHLDDDLAKVLEPGASLPSDRLALMERASELGIPVYAAIAPFMPFHSLGDLDALVAAVKRFRPTEIFCEVLNLKGDAVPMVAEALRIKYPSLARVIQGYDEGRWSRWTYEVLRHGVKHHTGDGFVAWPDTAARWRNELAPDEAEFLTRYLPKPNS